ncbi:hypothetical protein D3C73_1453600 [compost metagenome]
MPQVNTNEKKIDTPIKVAFSIGSVENRIINIQAAIVQVTAPIKKRRTENNTRFCVTMHPRFKNIPIKNAMIR